MAFHESGTQAIKMRGVVSVLREPTVHSRDGQGLTCQHTKHYTEKSRGTGRALGLQPGQERPEEVWTEARFEGQLKVSQRGWAFSAPESPGAEYGLSTPY